MVLIGKIIGINTSDNYYNLFSFVHNSVCNCKNNKKTKT